MHSLEQSLQDSIHELHIKTRECEKMKVRVENMVDQIKISGVEDLASILNSFYKPTIHTNSNSIQNTARNIVNIPPRPVGNSYTGKHVQISQPKSKAKTKSKVVPKNRDSNKGYSSKIPNKKASLKKTKYSQKRIR